MDKKKLNKNDFMFRNKSNEELIKKPGDINGIDFLLDTLDNCTVYLCDKIESINVDDCTNCKIYMGPVNTSLFVRDCKNLEIYAAGQQVRISNSENIQAYIFSQSEPALEYCKNIEFGPFNFSYYCIKQHFQELNINLDDPNVNKWSQVFDFTVATPSNWSIITPNRFTSLKTKTFEGHEDEEMINPVPLNEMYGGVIPDNQLIIGSKESDEDTSGMLSFNITTTQQQAQEKMEVKEQVNDEYNFDNEQEQPNNQQQQQANAYDFFYQENNEVDIQQETNLAQDTLNDKKIQYEKELQNKLNEKELEEYKLKGEIQEKAAAYIQMFNKQRLEQIEQQKQLSFEAEEAEKKKQPETSLSWAAIAKFLKSTTQEKDVTAMKRTLVNRMQDEEQKQNA